jgi:sulfite oxidase
MSYKPVTRRRFVGSSAVGLLGVSLAGLGCSNRLHAADPDPADLITRQTSPFNAEPPLPRLLDSWLTPVRTFFVRSHGDVPALRAADVTLTIDGLVDKTMSISVADLVEKFPSASATATLTCAGNRRSEFAAIKKVGGVQWDAGAIGNAEWQGVRLADVLKACGVKAEAKHVWFEGRDSITEKNVTFPFGGSVPLEKAVLTTATGACLLATKMNGQPLTPAHGFPLRTVVPGFIGARSVKWLHKITVADRPSPNHFVADVYKLVPEENAELIAKTTPIYEFALNSAICEPSSGATIKGERLTVKGFALTNGSAGRSVQKIEVSTDGGKTWTSAKITSPVRDYCWVLWSADVPVTDQTSTLTVRATDTSGETQPENCPWNYKGYQFNGWHRVPVKSA